MYKLKLGISLKYFKDNGVVRNEFESELNEVIRLGFESIDFDLTGINTLDAMLTVEETLHKGLEKVRESGLFFNAVHLPYRTGDYSGENETLRRELICNTINLFRIIDPYKPKCYIFHGSGEGWSEDRRVRKLQILKNSLETLVASTKTMVCVENLPRYALLNTSEEAVALVDSVEKAKLCCDVNHFLQETAESGVKKMGTRIGTLHISDHDYVNERHMLPKKGKIDWKSVISALEGINYDGAFTYEITFEQNGYTFCGLNDVKENYEELFGEYEEGKRKKEKDLNESIKEKTLRLWNDDKMPKTTITYYEPVRKSLDCAVLIFPGGGYSCRAPHEGVGYAKFLNSLGVAAFVVDYSVAPIRFPVPLLEARRAVRFIRYYAKEWGISKDKIVVMGSSAGGHLAALLCSYQNELQGEGFDLIDGESYLPNAQVLCYPVISSKPNLIHEGSYRNFLGELFNKKETLSPDSLVNKKTPQAFIWHTANDNKVDVRNSYLYAQRLRENNIPCELHVFPFGEHGIGLAEKEPHVAQWQTLLGNWLHLVFGDL